jgi:hypothetical protein
MTGSLVHQEQNPFARAAVPSGTNVGAVAIEQERAIAEAQGQLILAKRFPRDLNSAHAELMIACKSKAFADTAFYAVPNRGSGPSIRFAEEVARVFGNFQYGHRELSRTNGKSEVEVYAWDMEANNRSTRQITVEHVQDTKNGAKVLRDQADIDNKIANVASKQMRGRILALLPKWLVAEAIEECKKTIAGTNDEPISVRVRKMTQAFARFGVTTEHLERYLGTKLDDVMLDQLVDMTGVFNALREGAKPSDYFSGTADALPDENESVAKLGALAAKAAEATVAPANDNAPAAAKPEPRPRRQRPAAPAPTEPAVDVAATAAAEAEPEAQAEAQPDPAPAADTAAEGVDLF